MNPETNPSIYTSIYDRIGEKGLIEIVFKATPFPFRLITWPYGLAVYRQLIQQSDNLDDLQTVHGMKHTDSFIFRSLKFIRPRFKPVKDILQNKYGIE